MNNAISMTQFAATMAASMGVPAPEKAGKAFPLLEETMKHQGITTAKRVLIYNPDAVGMWLFQKYTNWYAPVLRHTQLGVPVCTVLPSVTPVCFGTMYTGVEPAVHGIQKYEKHLLQQESQAKRPPLWLWQIPAWPFCSRSGKELITTSCPMTVKSLKKRKS